MKTPLLVIAIASLCAGCAIIPEQVEVNYTPDAGTTRTRIMSANNIRLQVADARHAESPSWIADKKNGYGMRLASVAAQRPVADLVRDAVAQELTARGIRVGEGQTTVSVEVTRFESISQIRFFSIGAIGYADFGVQVRRADGSIAYARTFSVSNDDEASLAGTAGQARRSVESALSKVVGQIVSDPAFTKALSTEPRMT
jgi:uncharacterized lipoprotein YajG